MTIRDMLYLTTIGEEKSITKAANKLFVAQPALSQCLQKIEKELGTEIFVRTSSGVRPTVEGQCFLKFAAHTLLEYQGMQKQISDVKNKGGGMVTVGLTGTQATYVLPYFLPRFHQQYPNIEVVLVEDNSNMIEEKLASGEVDIGIVHLPILNTNLDYFELSQDDMVVIPRSFSRFQPYLYYLDGENRPYLDVEFLKNEPLVLTPANQRSRMICNQIFGKAGISPEVKQVSKNLIALDALAQADYATTIIPSKQASDALRRRGWYYFDPRYSVPYTFCVATLKHAYISMAAQKLLDMLYELRGTF